MPSHKHPIKTNQISVNIVESSRRVVCSTGNTINYTETAGGDQAHNNLQPYIVQNFIIKAYNNARTLSIVENSLDSDSTKNAVSVHIVNKKIAELQAQITALQTQLDTKSLNINGTKTIWYEDETNT